MFFGCKKLYLISKIIFKTIFNIFHLLRNDARTKGSPKWLMWQDIQEIKREFDKL